ncbi:MAG: MutS family DNA mismatch repair protein [Bdellovibrionota bacterium]
MNSAAHDPGRTPLVVRTLARARKLASKREKLGRLIARVRERVESHQRARLILAGAMALGLLAAALKPGLNLAPITLAIFIPPFAWLVILTRNRSRFLARLTRWNRFLERQENRLRGLPSAKSTNLPALSAEGEFVAHDLGLFGTHSLWGLVDETITADGRRELGRAFLSAPATAEEIVVRQNSVKAFRPERWFFTKLTFERDSGDELTFSANEARNSMMQPFVPRWFGAALIAVSILWIVAWTYALQFTSGATLVFMGFITANFALLFQAGPVFERGLSLSHHLGQLSSIFAALERRTKSSSRVRELCPMTSMAGPAREAKRIDRVLGILGVKTNPILHLLLNSLMPWSSIGSWLLERQRRRVHQSLPICMSELAQIEVLGSLVVFDHFQTSLYPTVNSARLSFEGLFHPLIDRDHVIANDFGFGDGISLGLLTGSNMSGKSTFLRAVGLNQILANMGAPVFAEAMRTKPMAVETCIEVSDSLRDGVSYFYAEVRRLKALIDHSKRGDGVLFLIDEIFRGTNNRERHIGSRAVVRALARAQGAQGFVSTHDLELTSLAEAETAVTNLHFRETVEAGKMAFSYRLHPGPSPTTNALRIMEMEGLPVEISS